MKKIITQNSFTHGEISPWVYGRSDIAQYKTSCRRAKNFIVRPQGSITKRPGSRYLAAIKNQSDTNVKLLDFIYSDSDSVCIEAGEYYFRFHTTDGTILSSAQFVNGAFAGNITGWTTNNTGTGSAAYNSNSANIAGGSSGVGRLHQVFPNLGVSQYTVTVTVATNSINYSVGSTLGGSEVTSGTLTVGAAKTFTFQAADNLNNIYISFNNPNNNTSTISAVSIDSPIYELKTPYTSAMLGGLSTDQTFDTMYFGSPDNVVRPKELIRYGASNWVLTDHEFYDGAYFNLGDKKWGGVGTGYTLTVTGSTSVGSSVTLTSSSPLFTGTDVGRWVRYRTLVTNAWGSLQITAYTSATAVTAKVIKVLPGTAASSQWRLGCFSDTTGWPRLVNLFSSRLVWYGTKEQPYHYFYSTADDLSNHDPDNADDKDEVDPDSSFVLRGQAITGSNAYSMINIDRNLFTISSGGVTLSRSGSSGEAIAFSNIKIDKILEMSCANVDPVIIESVPILVDKSRRSLAEVSYSFQEDRFQPSDITLLSEHATLKGCAQLAYSRVPNTLIWVRMLDGSLWTTTYNKQQNITGWSEQIIGGEDAKVEQLLVMPTLRQDETWLLVSRTIDNTTKRYIEIISPFYTDLTGEDVNFLDSYIKYSGAPNTVFTGANHLVGQEVVCWGDGGIIPTVSVVQPDGSIEISEEASELIIGLPYTSQFESNSVVLDDLPGGAVGAAARINGVSLNFYQSYSGSVAVNNGTDIVDLGEVSEDTTLGDPLKLFTGIRTINTGNIFSKDSTIIYTSGAGTPLSIRGIVYHISVENR